HPSSPSSPPLLSASLLSISRPRRNGERRSSPTRRTSDLDKGEGRQRFEHRYFDRLAEAGLLALVQRHGDRVGDGQARHLVGDEGDRKGTRLNSRHVKISDAVYRLEKKKRRG